MKKRKNPKGPEEGKRTMRCWEFFRCDPVKQSTCLIKDVDPTPCWLVDVACCRIPEDALRPISIKKVVCKSCAFYIYIHKTGSR